MTSFIISNILLIILSGDRCDNVLSNSVNFFKSTLFCSIHSKRYVLPYIMCKTYDKIQNLQHNLNISRGGPSGNSTFY